MKRLLIAWVVTSGCHDAAKDIDALANRACACADRVCAERVVDAFVAFAAEHKTAKGDEKLAAKAAEKMMRCAMKAGSDAATLAAKLHGVAD